MGVLSASMGIRREETERLQELQELRMVVRVDQVGQRNRDYQIAAKYKKTGEFDRNYVTVRDYLEDAVFLVAVEGEDDLMEQIYEALKRPYFQLYYGRRSCPVNYDFLVGIYEKAALEQIEEWPWIAAEWYQKRQSRQEKIRLDVYGDVTCMPKERQRKLRRDQPVSFSQMGRQHDLRYEVHKSILLNNPAYAKICAQTEHDAFSALMEG